MTRAMPKFKPGAVRVWIWGVMVAAVMAAYYAIFFFPPRLAGASEPDRYYHIGLSKLIAANGLIKSLPQVQDLGWGAYFPDKEFLFHALTGAAYWLDGPQGVLLLVPMLGIAVAASLYAALGKVLTPARAFALTTVAMLLNPVLLYRLTLLRPHLLAILCFCLLLAGLLNGRRWLAALAAAGFALSYHAFYIPVFVIFAAAVFPVTEQGRGLRCWQWAGLGLLCGIVLNPYFPSTLVMSWIHLKLALGIGLPPELQSGSELQPLTVLEYLDFFGYLPLALLIVGSVVIFKRLRPSQERSGFWFLLLLSAMFTALSMKSSRAIEYAIPCVVLLTGYSLSLVPGRRWVGLACLLLIATQGHSSVVYYTDTWTRPQQGLSGWYLSAIELLPPDASGKKIFNCEWAAGSYILLGRPDVHFVDLLEPALLWQASPDKFRARERLMRGESTNPALELRQQFKADYVLCGTRMLTQQLLADPGNFELVAGSQPGNPVRLFRVRN